MTHISFDCYGTLIDWESGILACFEDLKKRYDIKISDIEILKLYANFEADEEHKSFRTYREILVSVLERFANHLSFTLLAEDKYALAESVKKWPPFPDTSLALKELQKKYKLVIISNIDDDLFAYSEALMDIKFDHIFTAQQMKNYKPALANFEYVQNALSLDKAEWLHVAQSLYHDHVPASKLGIKSVWIKRKSKAGDQGVAPQVDYMPKEKYEDMKSFSEAILG
jgi:2-haloacid dehalogenase